MRTVSVKAHTRKIVTKVTDPLQREIDARRAAKDSARREMSESQVRERKGIVDRFMPWFRRLI